MLENLEKVITYASIAHGSQMMTEPDVPYVTHLFGVTMNVVEAYNNGNEKFDLDLAVKLAMLHDTIEDTSVTYEELLKEFGKEVADGVLALSKNDEIKKEDRIKDSVSRIKKLSKEVQIVKLSDRTFNMRCRPKKWDEEKCQKYLEDAKYILNELGNSNIYLKNKLQTFIDQY